MADRDYTPYPEYVFAPDESGWYRFDPESGRYRWHDDEEGGA